MATVTLAEAKTYLRVDSTTEDDLITKLIGSATATVENVLRQPLSAFDSLPDDIHTAILYTTAYLYENFRLVNLEQFSILVNSNPSYSIQF